MFLVLILYSLFGLTFTLGKINLFFGRPFFIVALRMLISGLGFLFFLTVIKKKKCIPHKHDLHLYLQIALFGIFVPYCLRAWGLQYVTSTKAAFLFTLMPFFTALFSYIFHRECLTLQKCIGLSLGFFGMLPTLMTGSMQESLVNAVGFISWPELAILGAVASFGYNLIATQKLVKHRGCHPMVANCISMLIGGSLAFGASVLTEPIPITGNIYMFFLLVGLQILISNILCLNLQAYLLNYYSPTFMAFASFLSPISAALYGYLFLGEHVSFNYIISFIIVLTGLIIFYFDDLKKNN